MRSLTLLFVLGLSACSVGVAEPALATAPVSSAAPGSTATADLLPQIRALVGAAECSESSQCQTLPLGARACGGPEAYLAWSSVRSDGAALRLLGERYQQQQRAKNDASGQVSDCRVIPDPGAECRAGSCQLRSNVPGGS